MPITLATNNYGKSRVRLVKVTRHADRHDLAELTVNVQFEGDFDPVHLSGDNSAVLPTDTMKNTVNALSKAWSGDQIEDFARQLTDHFLRDNPQVSRVRIEIAQTGWTRIAQHAFTRGSEERRTTRVTATRAAVEIESGIENLIVLKTSGSGFEGYKKDRYTTLKETTDRIFATAIAANWTYRVPEVAFGPCRRDARAAILKTFIERDSPSVQHTAYAMGEAVLQAVEDITEIRLSLPNKHCLLIDLAPFGLDNPNEIFVPTDEPHGLIEVSLKKRSQV
jgi:urate oxidase